MKLLFSFTLFFVATSLQSQVITTIAGNGTSGYSGDGGPAINAQLGDMYYCYPAIDNAGNIYIAQTSHNTIRKIDASGVITTIAGTPGIIGYSGDGGPAVNALLYHPTFIAIDNANNIFFGDRNGDIIRKIDPSGIITTVTGQATTACGVGDGGPLLSAQFWANSAAIFDQAGNLYISDFACNTVRKVNTSGVITTIAGNGTLGYSGDGGPATSAKMAYPCKVAVDNTGNVYIPDAQNHRIRKVSPAGIITTVAGNGTNGYSGDGGPALNAQLSFPGSVVIDNSGNLYIGDYNNVIRKIDPAGIITTFAGNGITGYSGDGGPAILASLQLTEGRISIDNNNNIYFVNHNSGEVVRKITNCLTASITQQPTNVSLCSSGNASFTIAATNANSHQWQVNTGTGWNNVVDNGTYSGAATNSLSVSGASVAMNNYQYRCVVNNSCGNIFSFASLLTVTAPSTPSITINATNTTICAGTNITFNATSLNGGAASVFQWKKNGSNVGTNSNTYTDNTLSNGDIISCILVSNAACVTTANATSNTLPITVTPVLTPGITISASANNICAGSPVNFISSINNGGTAPSYQWKKNGTTVGTNSASYSDNTFINGDIVSCTLTSNYSCPTSPSAASNLITMSVISLTTPLISINANATSICPGDLATFNAAATNAGPSPTYQWKKNGINVGSNATTYADNSINQGDIISCAITTATGTCLSTKDASSNTITMNLFNPPVVTLDQTSTLCSNSTRILNAGNFTSHIWSDGSSNQTLAISNVGTYYVTVIDKNGCSGSDTTRITTLLAQPAGFLSEDTSICNYGSLKINADAGYAAYSWNNNYRGPILTVTQAGTYWLEVTDNNNCKGRDTIIVKPKECLKGFYMPTGFTPNNDGKNDSCRPLIFGTVLKYKFMVFNRWGQIVFESKKLNEGWDGKIKGIHQNTAVFVWLCDYQIQGEAAETKKGTVVLIR
jgi:gliding motility-associated-like protein